MAKDLASSIAMAVVSFVGDIDGTVVMVRKGDLLYPDDPIVRKWPDKFGQPKVRGYAAPVEQATAAPGEKRGA
jgi:hypothetical protein